MNDNNIMVSDISDILTKTAIITLEKQNIKYTSDENCIINFLDLTSDELQVVAGFVVEVLPQYIYLEKHSAVRNYALFLISKELIIFLLQEDKKSSAFQHNITNLRNKITEELLNNIYIKNTALI